VPACHTCVTPKSIASPSSGGGVGGRSRCFETFSGRDSGTGASRRGGDLICVEARQPEVSTSA
jgi:hypothetical protein